MDRRQFVLAVPALAASFATPGCADQKSHAQAVYMLIDTSGTYAEEIGKAQASRRSSTTCSACSTPATRWQWRG